MKKWMIAAAAVAGTGLTGGTASAQFFGGPPVEPVGGPMGGGVVPASHSQGGGESCTECEDRYGAHPIFKKMMFWKKPTKKAGKAHVAPPPGAPGGPQVGTLVFPNHPFVRSPRDFFMYGQGGS